MKDLLPKFDRYNISYPLVIIALVLSGCKRVDTGPCVDESTVVHFINSLQTPEVRQTVEAKVTTTPHPYCTATPNP